MRVTHGHLTEKQLREHIAELEQVMKDGNATECDANRLADLRRQLRRIETVKWRNEIS